MKLLNEKLQQELHNLAEKEKVKLYAIADGGVYRKLLNDLIGAFEYRILFSGKHAQIYEEVAPYLVELNLEDDATKTLIEKGFGATWLTFVTSQYSLDDLSAKLAKRIITYSKTHEREVIFRFYDPRNLEKYFAMQDTQERQILFTELINAFAYVDLIDETKLNTYTIKGVRVIQLSEN
jgi:hypothetical protein